MAIDTQAKRMSATGAGRPWLRATLPNAVKPTSWRAAIANVYGYSSFDTPSSGFNIPPVDKTKPFEDRLLSFYLLNGGISRNIMDAEREFLTTQGANSSVSLADAWKEFFTLQSVADRTYQDGLEEFLVAQGMTEVTVMDKFKTFVGG